LTKNHKHSKLSLAKQLIPIDEHTTFLAHYDICENDVIRGIEPISNISTLRPFEGYFGGGIAIEEGTTNYFINGDLSSYTTGYNPNWDSSLNGDLNPSYMSSGYNGGVTSANVGYHAHLNIDRFGYPVLEYIDMNGQFGHKHRWLGVSEQFTTNVSGNLGWGDGTQVTYSFDMMADGIDKGINLGLYHRNADNTSNTFGSTSTTFYVDKPYEWERKSATVALKASEWDFTQWGTLYIYGHQNRNDYEGIGWVKNIQIETKGIGTSFTNETRLNGSLVYPNDGILDPKEGTLSLWFASVYDLKSEPTGMGVGQGDRSIARTSNGHSAGGGFMLYLNDGNQLNYMSNGVSLLGSNGLTWKKNEFHMVTINWSEVNNKRQLFVDGKLVGTSTYQPMIMGDLQIGYQNSNIIVDELRIDNIFRTEHEIESWYISQLPFYPKGIYRLAY
jgi:hypothetical protein